MQERSEQTLRPYQQRAVTETHDAWAAGKRNVCIVAPTGAGKSVIAAALLAPVASQLGIVHTRVLRQQTERRIPGARVVTIQSLLPDSNRAESRREMARAAERAFIDECHHIVGEEWRAAVPLLSGATVFGCTATPQRADGTPLGDVFDHLVVAAQYHELLTDGFLCPCDIAKPAMSRAQMKRAKVKPDPVKAYLAQGKRADGSWRPAILFAPTIALCTEHVEALRLAGVRAELVCADTTETVRQETFDRYSRGELDLLASPYCLAEGFDAARAEVIVLARLAAHLGTFLQMCGRVLRPYGQRQIDDAVAYWAAQGKTLDPAALIPKSRALLIDCSDAASVHGNPTDDRKYSLTGKGIEAVEPEEEDEEEKTPIEMTREELIEMEFTILRQQLSDNIAELHERAKERGYKDSWVYFRIRERYGIELPRMYPSKYQSVCPVCRRRVTPGENIYWTPPGEGNAKSITRHPDCFINTLPGDVLALVRAAS